MAIYMCGKCSKILNSGSMPKNSLTCHDKSWHDWREIAEEGTDNYECRKCGLTLQCKSMPKNLLNCDDRSWHDWRKL